MIRTFNLLSLLIFFSSIVNSAQSKEWETELSEDGKTKVVYSIYDSLNVKGEEVKFIEYTSKQLQLLQ